METKYVKDFLSVLDSFRTEHERSDKMVHINRGERAILRHLHLHPEGLTPGQLSKIMNVGSGRIGNVLKVLEGKRLIYRDVCEEDKRKVIIHLTKEGEKVQKNNELHFFNGVNLAVSRMGEEQYYEYLRLLNIFLEALDEKKED